jgi:transposase
LADFAITWSYLSTAAKHDLDHLDVLVELFTTGPSLPRTRPSADRDPAANPS